MLSGEGNCLQLSRAECAVCPAELEGRIRTFTARIYHARSREPNVLSQTVEYAFRAVVQLAYNQQQLCSTSFLAEKTKVPPAYLSKVLQSLVRAGIVYSQRGVGGGMSLQIPADKLTLLDIVNAVDPIKRIHSCPLNIKRHGTVLCPLHRRLDTMLGELETSLREATLADILAERSQSVPLCEEDESPLGRLIQFRAPPAPPS